MNSKFRITIYLLVMALLVVGLAACEQSAPERESEAAEGSEATAPSVGGEESPEPGQTVVSAVTPETETPGGAEEQPTQVPAIDTPGSEEPQATEAPAPTDVPSAPEQPPAQGEGSIVFHTVQPGDTLYSIARQYDTTAQAISRVNGLTNPDQIAVGDKLRIPTASGGSGSCRIRHTVQQGEWVWQIARNYGVDPYSILAANGLTVESADPIYPGTILCIP